MKITIGICTRNNQNGLSQCLNSIFLQRFNPSDSYEIIIIDQSDDYALTKKVINKYNSITIKKRLKIFYYRNHKKGISFARNQLFKTASGYFLFTTDDDVMVSKNWILNGSNFLKKNINVGVVGGKVILHNKIPNTIAPYLKSLGFSSNFWPYALIDLGNKPTQVGQINKHTPVFANMGIKKEIYKNIKINTTFGNTNSLLKVYGGEDPDFIEKANKVCDIYFIPNTPVYHNLAASRFTPNFFYWKYGERGRERAIFNNLYSRKSLLPRESHLRKLRFLDLTNLIFIFRVGFNYFAGYFITTMYLFLKKRFTFLRA